MMTPATRLLKCLLIVGSCALSLKMLRSSSAAATSMPMGKSAKSFSAGMTVVLPGPGLVLVRAQVRGGRWRGGCCPTAAAAREGERE